MTKIYLIRHAEAEGNLYRIAHGQEEGLITDYRGPRQMQALARRFRDIPVDAVYASDLIRTQTTAQAVYVPKGLPLHLEPDRDPLAFANDGVQPPAGPLAGGGL